MERMLPWTPQVDAPHPVRFCRDPGFHIPFRHFPGVLLLLLQFLTWNAYAQVIESPPIPAQSNEFQIKAAFIFHFAQLVDWPQSSFGPAGSPLTICTLGRVYFPGVLESAVQGKKIGARPIRVRQLADREDFQSCHLLFILGNNKKWIVDVLTAAKNLPVLTVGEADDFVPLGGMIGFRLLDNKVRFDINLQASRQANLKISSRLLLLAQGVTGDSGQG
jgi:YfiR/HmsC-like